MILRNLFYMSGTVYYIEFMKNVQNKDFTIVFNYIEKVDSTQNSPHMILNYWVLNQIYKPAFTFDTIGVSATNVSCPLNGFPVRDKNIYHLHARTRNRPPC